MMNEYERLERCLRAIREKTDFIPKVALVLGSGLGNFGDTMDLKAVVDYKDIEGFPVSTAPGHKGRFLFGMVGGTPVVCMQGRVHYYEGYDMSSVVLPIRLMGLLGAKFLILTNASGGISTRFRPGDLMMITDQISCFVPSPLRGENIGELGKRFPDMSQIYDWELQKIIIQKALEENIDLKDGVYIQTQGPNYESPAEVNMCRLLGGDAVGMSTACEAVAANHMGIRIAGISCISNMAAGISPVALSEEEVIEAANQVADKFTRLVSGLIKEIGKRY